MFGARSGRPIEARDEDIGFSHLSMAPRRPQAIYGGVGDSGGRGSRGKALLEEDLRVGSSRGERSRVPRFSGKTSRGDIEHAGHRHSDDAGRYGGVADRRFRVDEALKIVRARDESPPPRDSARYRDGAAARRGERVGRPLAYSDNRIVNGYESGLNYDVGSGRDGGLRDSDYLQSRAKSTGGSITAVLPGLVFECSRRTILEFSSQKGSFVLPIEDLQLAEQIGPGTRIFMFDSNAREIHGVFQAESYRSFEFNDDRTRDSEESVVRVRVEKECLPLDERQFKAVLHENYYTSSKFSESLSKDQVMKLLQTFRPVNSSRVPVSLPVARRNIDSSVSHTGNDFQGASYRDERWRRGAVDTASVGGQYHTADGLRFSSKIPLRGLSTKSLDDYEDYVDEEAMDEMPLSSPRLIAGSNPYATSRSKQQQSLRTLPGSRTAVSHLVGNVDHSDLKVPKAGWRDDRNLGDLVYSRKRLPPSRGSVDDLNRGDRSSSPPFSSAWGHSSRVDTAAGELYDQPGRSASRDELSYIPSRRRRPSELDLNIPLDVVHAEPAHVHDVVSKPSGQRGWNDDDEKRYSISPLKGRSDPSRDSLHRSNHHVVPRVDNYDDKDLRLDTRLDSRHMPVVTRIDYTSLLQMGEKGHPLPSSYSNGKLTKSHPRSAQAVKNYHDKSVVNLINRKKGITGKDIYTKETLPKGPKVPPVFQIKANLQASGRGRAERVVTMVDKDRPWLTGSREKFIGGPTNVIQAKKRKASVWSRIELPDRGIGQTHVPFIANERGRVFSRLGPSVDTMQLTGDFAFGYQTKRPRIQYEDMDFEADFEKDQDVEDSPDALQGEDYLQDDDDDDMGGGPRQGDKEAEVIDDQLTGEVNDSLQGWNRKKSSVVHSGIASAVVGNSDCTSSVGGRRKLVRPSIDENVHVEQVPVSAGGEADKTFQPTSTEMTEVARTEERAAQEPKTPPNQVGA